MKVNKQIENLEIKKIEIIRSLDSLKEKFLENEKISSYFKNEYIKNFDSLEARLLQLNFNNISDITKLYTLYKEFNELEERINKQFNTSYTMWNINFNKKLFYIIIPLFITLAIELQNHYLNNVSIDENIKNIVLNILIVLNYTNDNIIVEQTRQFIEDFVNTNIIDLGKNIHTIVFQS